MTEREHLIMVRLAGARLASVELTYQVETTMKWLEQMPPEEPPTPADVENLRRVIEYRTAQVDKAVRVLQASVQAALHAELILAERRVT